MSTTKNRSTAQILASIPSPAQQVRSQSQGGLGLVDHAALRSLAIAALRGRSRVLTGLAFAAATAGTSTIALYRLKHTAGAVLSDGVAFIENAVDPLIIVGAGQNINDAIDLDGEDAVVLTAAGKARHCVILGIVAGGVGKKVAVFGAEADNGEEEVPTYAQIRAALTAKYADDWDGVNGIVLARVKFQRKKVITYVAAGTVAEGGTFAITINGTEYPVTADADDVAADIGGKLRAAIGANEEGVTVSGAGANVILTGAAGTTFTSSSAASGAGTLVGTQADTMTDTLTDPDANAALLAERSAGGLWEDVA